MRLAKKHPGAVERLNAWYTIAHSANWTRLEDVRKDFPSADQVGNALVFNVLYNDFRLIATVDYPTRRMFVKALLTHKEYDRKEWMKWAKR